MDLQICNLTLVPLSSRKPLPGAPRSPSTSSAFRCALASEEPANFIPRDCYSFDGAEM